MLVGAGGAWAWWALARATAWQRCWPRLAVTAPPETPSAAAAGRLRLVGDCGGDGHPDSAGDLQRLVPCGLLAAGAVMPKSGECLFRLPARCRAEAARSYTQSNPCRTRHTAAVQQQREEHPAAPRAPCSMRHPAAASPEPAPAHCPRTAAAASQTLQPRLPPQMLHALHSPMSQSQHLSTIKKPS